MSKPFVLLELDYPRKLRYSIKAIKEIEQLLGGKLASMNFSNIGADELVKIIYAGIDKTDGLNIQKLEDLLDEHYTFNELMLKFGEAFSDAQPKNA